MPASFFVLERWGFPENKLELLFPLHAVDTIFVYLEEQTGWTEDIEHDAGNRAVYLTGP